VTGVAVERVKVAAYTVPTDAPESDGTLELGRDDDRAHTAHAAAAATATTTARCQSLISDTSAQPRGN
jgi:hypothetical protein